MPIVEIPDVYLGRDHKSPTWSDVRVEGRTLGVILDELFSQFPQLDKGYVYSDGTPCRNWFGLWLGDELDLRYEPDRILDPDDRLLLINMIGC